MFNYPGKYYVGYVADGTADERALEAKRACYKDPAIIYDEVKRTTGEAYKYNFGDVTAEGEEVTARYHYSVVDKFYWVKTDNKGGRKYIKEA